MALAWGIALLLLLPRGLGAWALGPVWRQTYPLVLPQVLFVIGQAGIAGPGAGLHALGAARRSLRGMILMSASYLACSLVGAALGGTVGTVRGLAVAGGIGALISWWQFRAALHESGHVLVSHRSRLDRPAGRHRRTNPRPDGH